MSEKQDANTLAREANKALRDSQRAMFNGKLEQAQTNLDAAAELLERIQALDPAFGQLKGLESKYAKQKKDLERRLPQTQAPPEKPAPAQADAPAPTQDVSGLAREADKALRASQRAMFSGKLEAAQTDLDAAAELIEQIKRAAPDSSQLKGLEGKHAKQKGDLDRRLPQAPADAPAESEAPATTPSADKLPGGVTHRLQQIDRTLARGEQVLAKDTASDDWKAAQLESIVDQAKGFIDEIMSGYGQQIPAGHPEVQTRQERIAELEGQTQQFKADAADREAAAAQQEAQRQAQSDEWLAQLGPYLTGPGQSGYDETQYLIPSGTEEVAELKRRKTIYDQAAALFAEYQGVDFPNGKTDEMERAEKELAYALENFSQG
jgi:hypothetical protein